MKEKNKSGPGYWPETKTEPVIHHAAKIEDVVPRMVVNPPTENDNVPVMIKTDEIIPSNNDGLALALSLLMEAQAGFRTVIGGNGPYEDRINGIFFSNIEDGATRTFLLSKWNEQVDLLINALTLEDEADHGTH